MRECNESRSAGNPRVQGIPECRESQSAGNPRVQGIRECRESESAGNPRVHLRVQGFRECRECESAVNEYARTVTAVSYALRALHHCTPHTLRARINCALSINALSHTPHTLGARIHCVLAITVVSYKLRSQSLQGPRE